MIFEQQVTVSSTKLRHDVPRRSPKNPPIFAKRPSPSIIKLFFIISISGRRKMNICCKCKNELLLYFSIISCNNMLSKKAKIHLKICSIFIFWPKYVYKRIKMRVPHFFHHVIVIVTTWCTV